MDAQPIQLHWVQKVDAVAVVDAPCEWVLKDIVVCFRFRIRTVFVTRAS